MRVTIEAMRLKVVQLGEPVLREQARPLTSGEIRSEGTQQLIEWMRETMYDAPGVGLAAPQVGVALQLAVIEDKVEYQARVPPDALKDMARVPVPFHVIINPKIKLYEGKVVTHYEGCLSFVGFAAKVTRAARVRVECLDHKGEAQVIEASGWYARILQHEIDHLHGTVYVDRMDTRTLASVENLNRYQGGLYGKG